MQLGQKEGLWVWQFYSPLELREGVISRDGQWKSDWERLKPQSFPEQHWDAVITAILLFFNLLAKDLLHSEALAGKKKKKGLDWRLTRRFSVENYGMSLAYNLNSRPFSLLHWVLKSKNLGKNLEKRHRIMWAIFTKMCGFISTWHIWEGRTSVEKLPFGLWCLRQGTELSAMHSLFLEEEHQERNWPNWKAMSVSPKPGDGGTGLAEPVFPQYSDFYTGSLNETSAIIRGEEKKESV